MMLLKFNRTIIKRLIFTCFLSMLVTYLSSGGLVQSAEDDIYTLKFPARSEASLNNIVLIDIDDQSLSQLGSWPLDRSVYADLASKTLMAGASVVAFDLVLPNLGLSNSDKVLVEMAQSRGNIVFGIDEPPENIFAKNILTTAPAYGHINALQDKKGRVIAIKHETYSKSLSEVVVEKYCAFEKIKCSNLRPKLSSFQPDSEYKQELGWAVNYLSPLNSIQRLSLIDVLQGKIPSLNHKIILVAPSAARFGDMKLLPFEWRFDAKPQAGTFVIAYGVLSILNQSVIWNLSPMQYGLVIFSVAICLLNIAYGKNSNIHFFILILAALYLFIWYFGHKWFSFNLHLIQMEFSVLLTWLAAFFLLAGNTDRLKPVI